MSGNFWKSSHYQQWILDPQDILMHRLKELQVNNLKEDEYYKLMIFFTNVIQSLGEHLKMRQQVIASGIVYFRRFYSKYSLKCIDPCLMVLTCLFLATKVEEFGLHPQQRYAGMTSQLLKAKYSHIFNYEYPYKLQHVWESEFYLLEVMDCCLILYHPYRPLIQFISDLCPDDPHLLPVAWRVVNDAYRTDVVLMYPPSLIALACLHIACVMQKKDAKQWFSELNVDMEKVIEITRHIMFLYEVLKTYDEKEQIKEILGKIAKPKVSQNPTTSVAQQQQQQQHPRALQTNQGQPLPHQQLKQQ